MSSVAKSGFEHQRDCDITFLREIWAYSSFAGKSEFGVIFKSVRVWFLIVFLDQSVYMGRYFKTVSSDDVLSYRNLSGSCSIP